MCIRYVPASAPSGTRAAAISSILATFSNRAASVLHEAVHVIDDLGGDPDTHIPERYVTDATADSLGLSHVPDMAEFATRYDLMPTAKSLHNPAGYASFAQHVAIGRDTRFGEGHADL